MAFHAKSWPPCWAERRKNMNKLTYENVTMRFGDVTALDHVSLTLEHSSKSSA